MKTFTKILLAAGIIGAIGKFVNDHIVISVKKKEPEEKKPALVLWDWEETKLAEYSAEDALALTELPDPGTLPAYADVDHELLLFQGWNWSLANIKTWIQNHEGECLNVGAIYTTTYGQDHNSKIEILYDAALDGLTDFDDLSEPDHIHYDNKYNVCKIYKDDNGCPWLFEFVHPGDAECALYDIADDLLKCPNGFGCSAKISLKDVFDKWGLIIDDYQHFADWFVWWYREDFINANYENADPNVVSFGEFESPKEELK